MTALELADALEGKREGHEYRARCPLHGGRSLFITEKDGRFLIVCRAGCSQNEVIKALRSMGLWGGNEHHQTLPPREPEPKDDLTKRIDKADRLWNESHPIEPGDPVWLYLKNRGITLTEYPQDLHTHPALPYWEVGNTGKPVKTGIFPAMLAIIRSPAGKPVGIHRTWISPDGSGKAPVESPKKLYKVHDLAGLAVRLFSPRDGVLGICEGIEDALSAWILWKIPTWACLGTSGMKVFQAPEGIKEFLIFSDRDASGAGQKAGWELKDRMAETGRAARVLVPQDGSKDLNAFLLARQEANIQETAR